MVECITSQYAQSHMYAYTENKVAILFDPCPSDKLINMLEQEEIGIEYIFLTHEHYDHISGVEFYQERYDCKVICTEECAERIQNPRFNLSAYFNALMNISGFNELLGGSNSVQPFKCKADITFNEDTFMQWNGHEIRMLLTPGHTSSSASYVIDNKLLFSGDMLFANHDTVTKFPTGSRRIFEKITLPKLRDLPKTLDVYPGHYQTFKLGDKVDLK